MQNCLKCEIEVDKIDEGYCRACYEITSPTQRRTGRIKYKIEMASKFIDFISDTIDRAESQGIDIDCRDYLMNVKSRYRKWLKNVEDYVCK